MNIGQKITLLKESMGFKNYKDFAKFVDLPSDWCLDLSKKIEVTNIDISRLVKIACRFNVSVDWLLSDDSCSDCEGQGSFSEDDIAALLDNIKEKIKGENCRFEGTVLSGEVGRLTSDCIDVVKKFIKQNV